MTGRLPAARTVTSALLVALLLVAGGALRSADPAGATASGRMQPAGEIRLELTDQDIAFPLDGDLRLVFRLAGDLMALDALVPATTTTTTTSTTTDGQPPADEAPPVEPLSVFVVSYPPLSPDDDPARYIGRDPRTSVYPSPIDGVVVPDARDLLDVADDGTVTLDLSISTDSGESVEDRIGFDEPGLYPVVVSLIAGGADELRVIATYGTLVQRLAGPDDRLPSAPIDLAIAVAIEEIGPSPGDGESSAARAELDAALALTAAIESPITLSIPPIVLEAAADRDRAALADALTGDRLVSVPATPLDVSSAAAADVTDVFARQLREGEDRLTAAVPANVARRDLWIATEPLSAAGAQVVRDLGYRYVVMTPALFAASVGGDQPDTDLFAAIALPDGGTLPLLVVDALGTSLTSEATERVLLSRTAVEWAVGEIAGLLLDQEGASQLLNRSRIIATPDLAAPDPRLLAPFERLVRTTPGVRFTEAGNLPGVTDTGSDGGQDVTVELPATAGPDLAERLARLDATALAMLSAGSMLPTDDPRQAAWSAQIAELVSTGYSDEEVRRVLDVLIDEAEELKGSVTAPDPFTFTLTGRAGDIDIRLGNTTDEPLTVLLRLSSPKLAFPDGDQIVELRPNDQTMVEVPVRARTNGTSAVRVEVLTPAGEVIGQPVVLTSRVNALTGFGQVLTAGLVLVLLTWWFSHWRARRRVAVAEQAGVVMERHPSNRQ